MTILPPNIDRDQSDLPLPAVPPLVGALLLRWLQPILAWLSALVMRALLHRCRDHPLLLLHRTYDPTPVVQACAAFHHQAGPGRHPDYSVALLLRAELLRVWFGGLADRPLECLLATNLLARWFVGLSLFAPSPDHATLARFHAFLCATQPATLFDHVLATLDRLDPEDPAETPQILDTFALRSPAAPTSPAVILLRLCGQLAQRWIAQAPAHLQHALPPLDLGPLLHPPSVFTAEQRAQRRQQAVVLAQRLQAHLAPHVAVLDPPLRAQVLHLLALLAKVSADEYILEPDGTVRARRPADKGRFRLASPVDTEATFRVHGDDQQDFGFNAAIATTTTRIRAAVVLTGSTPDNETIVPLLQQQQQAGRPLPPVVVMDQAGGHGKTRARVRSASDGQTTMVAWVPQSGGADQARFTPADFLVDPERTQCRCPNNLVSTTAYRSAEGDGVHFRFTAEDCAACPLWTQCRKPGAKANGHRTVFVSDYHQHQREAAAFNATADGKALLGQRWRVEPTIAWLVRYDGCRRSRRVGQAAAQGQLWMACAVRNLRRWLGRLQRGLAPPPPRPAMGGVCP